MASFFSNSRFRSQFALLGAILKRSCSRFPSRYAVGENDKSTDQLLSAFPGVLFDDLFRQSLYVLLHRIFHFYIFVVSSFFERSCLGVEVPVLNERLWVFYSTVVRRQNRSDLSGLLTHPPLFLLPYAFVKRGDEPCELVRYLPKTLRRLERGWLVPESKPLGNGCLNHVCIPPIIRVVLVETRRRRELKGVCGRLCFSHGSPIP